MKRELLVGVGLIAMMSAAPMIATADQSMPANGSVVQIADTTAAGEVDAGKLVGKEVYDANGDKVGEIDSVMVDQGGKVNSVIIDVSGWLESEKLIAL